MALEVIQCTKCGSTEVTEFKTDTYVCGHCETTFKTQKQANNGDGGCQIGSCGVPAIGLCHQCHQRFCRTHQAIEKSWSSPDVPILDLCSYCQARRLAAEANAKRERATALDAVTTARDLLDVLVNQGKECDTTLVCDTWRRLARAGGLPNPSNELVRFRHHQLRESIWKGSIYEISEPERLGPIWLSPKSVTLAPREYSDGTKTPTTADGLITSDAHMYEYLNTTWAEARNALHLSDHETLVMVERGRDLGVSRKVAVGSGIFLPIDGATVRRQVASSWSDTPSVIRLALEHYGV